MSKEHAWKNVTYGDRVLMTLKAPLKGVIQGTIKTIETVEDDGLIKRKGISLGAPDDCVVYLDYADIEDFHILPPLSGLYGDDPYDKYTVLKVEVNDGPRLNHHVIAEKWADGGWRVLGEHPTKTYTYFELRNFYVNKLETNVDPAIITPLYLHPKDD